LLLSVGPLDVTSGAGAAAGSDSAVAALAFFFFADLDSDFTCGFWVAGAAILKIGIRLWEALEVGWKLLCRECVTLFGVAVEDFFCGWIWMRFV
jgi:hypothetical protein